MSTAVGMVEPHQAQHVASGLMGRRNKERLSELSHECLLCSAPSPPSPVTLMTTCSAPSSLSVEGPLPRGTRGHCSSVTWLPSSTAQTLMLEVKTKEPPDAGPDQRSIADWT